MIYDVVNQICEEVDTDITPFYNSIEIKGDRILLFRDKIVQKVETQKTSSYNELVIPIQPSLNDSSKDIDEVIHRLREYYKEKLVIFYKSSESRN
ncbi:MAG: hypothetical protein ACTSVO_03655 [Candidatus Heimdallarchaeaceae archaeon]